MADMEKKSMGNQMEQVDIKGPPPTYVNDTDVDSIVKPNSTFEGDDSKPISAWRNNFFLRSKRRAFASGAVVGVAVILAIVLGVLASVGLVGKHHQPQSNGYCGRWEYGIPLTNTPSPSPGPLNLSVVRCAIGVNGWDGRTQPVSAPSMDLINSDSHCLLWISDTVYPILGGGYVNTGMNWRCGNWDATGPPATTTEMVGIATASATVYYALGASVSAPSVLLLLSVALGIAALM